MSFTAQQSAKAAHVVHRPRLFVFVDDLTILVSLYLLLLPTCHSISAAYLPRSSKADHDDGLSASDVSSIRFAGRTKRWSWNCDPNGFIKLHHLQHLSTWSLLCCFTGTVRLWSVGRWALMPACYAGYLSHSARTTQFLPWTAVELIDRLALEKVYSLRGFSRLRQ